MRKLKKFLTNLIPSKRLRQKIKFTLQIHGEKNTVEGRFPKRINGEIYGNNNKIIFGNNLDGFHAAIWIGTKDCPVNDCTVTIGDNSTANHTELRLLEDNSRISVGKDCMFSSGINIWCSDTHSIVDNENKITNVGKFVEIGDHVWIGMDVKICKNTKIADNSIVGWNSVVTKKFDKKGIVIAGNPAKEVKENVNWSRLRPKQFLQNVGH